MIPENLYIPDSHKAIIHRIAEKTLLKAALHLSTAVKRIESKSRPGEDPKVYVRTKDGNYEFDEVVVTIPLGCLKRKTIEFMPPVLQPISQAISNSSFSCLEKIYVTFPSAFWQDPGPKSNGETANVSEIPGFIHFLHPTYVPENQRGWTLELNCLSSTKVFGDHAQPTLLFHTYGPCATYVTSLIRELEPTSSQYRHVLEGFFKPYYSLLPNFNANNPACTPSAILATNWQNDDLAGNGSYVNFQIQEAEGDKKVLLDEDIKAMRKGMPERGVWFAGEHTAPFVAVATTSGAYWSGESIGIRILGANGLLPEVVRSSSGA